MSTRKIMNAKDLSTNELIYFRSHAKATYMSDGTTTVEDAINAMGNNSNSSVASVAYPLVNHGTADTTFTLTPNVFHVWDEVTSLTLTLGEETAGVANEFFFQFNSGSTATTLTLPDTIKWANDNAPIIESNKIYQISILRGLGSVLEFTITIPVVLINFTIDSTEVQAEEGMTWGEWTTSKYNTLGCIISGTYIVINGSLVTLNGSVSSTDLIIADASYRVSTQGGGGGGSGN